MTRPRRTPMNRRPPAGPGTPRRRAPSTPPTALAPQVSDLGDVSVPSQAACTTTSYAQNTTAGILDDVSEVKLTAGRCGTANPALLSDTRHDYDGGAFAAAPTAGNDTETDVY